MLERFLKRKRPRAGAAPAERPESQPPGAEDEASAPAFDRRAHRAACDSVAAALRWVRAGGPVWRLGRHSVYRLPWYVVLADAGAGTSSLLRAWGQRPAWRDTVGKTQSHHGFGRWWFDERAVTFETTASAATDDAHWNALLEQFTRVRRRCPLNGIVVAVSAERLVDGDEAACGRIADTLRARIDAAYRVCGRRVPVYVTVTHCDRLSGFDAFVRDLDDVARERALAIVFPLKAEPMGEAWVHDFTQSFEALTRDARRQLIERMPAHQDSQRAAATYRFPQSLEELRAPLGRFLRNVFGASPDLCEPMLLRGVNLSAVAGGSVESTQSSSSPDAAGRERAWFVKGWLSDVVLRERDLALSPHAALRRRALRSRLAAVSCAALALCGALALVSAHQRAIAALATSASSAAALVRAAERGVDLDTPRTMLPVLDAARGLACGPDWRASERSWAGRFEFGRDAHLEAACRDAYRAVLRETIEPYLLARTTQVVRGEASDPTSVYEALRVYLMLGEKARFDRTSVLAWLEGDASRQGLPSQERAKLLVHASAWADAAPAESNAPLDASLVDLARERLRVQPEAQRVLDAVLPALADVVPAPLSVADMAGRGAALVLDRKSSAPFSDGVPGVYTRAGVDRYLSLRDAAIARVRREHWVTGTLDARARAATSLADEVDRLYFVRYQAAWDRLLADVGLRPLAPSDEGEAVVRLLAGPQSPLRLFLLRAAKETSLATPLADTAAAPLAPSAQGRIGRALGKVRQWFGARNDRAPNMNVAPSAADNEAARRVDSHFAALHRLAGGPDAAGASPLDRAQAQLKEVAVFLQAADVARANGLPPPPDDALQKLLQNAGDFPAPLADMLKGLGQAGRGFARSAERVRIGERWRADVAGFCHAALDGRYPFASGAAVDVTLNDFARLFAPGGLLDTFFQANLKPYVDTTTTPWSWRAAFSGMPSAPLLQFERAARIRDAFFPEPGKPMDLRFTLRPRSLDPRLAFFTFAFGGQTVSAAQRAPLATRFEWPDETDSAGARIDYLRAGGDAVQHIEAHGPWSLFRLLDQGRLEAVTPDRLTLTYALDEVDVVLELAASSVVNPFALPALRAFRCPAGI